MSEGRKDCQGDKPMTADILAKELAILERRFALELEGLAEIADQLLAGRNKAHGAHALASRAQDMASLAGQIEAVEKILRSLTESDRGQDPRRMAGEPSR